MKIKLLSYIMCPRCSVSFDMQADKVDTGGEILKGSLRCGTCQACYPIIDGIPRILPGQTSAEQRATADAFGYEWTHFSQLEDTYELEFLDWIDPVKKEFFRDKVVLDAGCGKGRHCSLDTRW